MCLLSEKGELSISHLSPTSTQDGPSLFLLGSCLGPLLAAPLRSRVPVHRHDTPAFNSPFCKNCSCYLQPGGNYERACENNCGEMPSSGRAGVAPAGSCRSSSGTKK